MNKIKIKRMIAASLLAVVLITAGVYKFNQAAKEKLNSNTTVTAKEVSTKTAQYDSLFEKDKVMDIKINISEADLKTMMDNPQEEKYQSADVTVNGTTVKNIGIRTKGNLTLKSVASTDSDRFSFRIKLDEYVKGQNILGLDEFVVNNMYSDPSYMREYLSYEALRELGEDVPETAFANIYVNDKLYGFYLCVESIDDSFLKRNFGDNDGSLYKQEKGSTLQYKENESYDSYELKEGDDESKSDLKNFIKTLNEMTKGEKGNIESVLDVDSALKYIAANTVLGNYDSYSGNMTQNYFLYGQGGKFTVLPWDYNMSFGGFGMGGNATTIPIDEPVMGVNMSNLPLINNLLAVKEYKEKYHEYVNELVKYLENFETRVTELSNIIRPYVEADPSKFYTMEQFEANIKYSETEKNNSTNKMGQMPAGDVNGAPNMQGQMPANMDGQMPKDIQGAMPPMGQNVEKIKGNANGQMPQNGDRKGNMPAMPQRAGDGKIKGGPNGGGMMTGGSIINYVRDRLENIKKQFSGELPTTGNTTTNNNNKASGK